MHIYITDLNRSDVPSPLQAPDTVCLHPHLIQNKMADKCSYFDETNKFAVFNNVLHVMKKHR